MPNPKTAQNPISRTAYVLSGGGAKGAFQVGVLLALAERQASPDVLYGTSVGALNAAGYAFQGPDGLERLWRGIRRRRDIISGGGLLYGIRAMVRRGKGLHTTKPLRRLIAAHVQGEPAIRVVVPAVNLQTGQIEYFETSPESPNVEHFARGLLGSASMPIIMDLVGALGDGGVREMTPLRRAIDEGAERVVVVLANPYRDKPAVSGRVGRLLDVAKRTLDIMSHEIFLNDIHLCELCNAHGIGRRVELQIYAPDQLLIDTLQFEPQPIGAAIEQGRHAVEAGPVAESGVLDA